MIWLELLSGVDPGWGVLLGMRGGGRGGGGGPPGKCSICVFGGISYQLRSLRTYSLSVCEDYLRNRLKSIT